MISHPDGHWPNDWQSVGHCPMSDYYILLCNVCIYLFNFNSLELATWGVIGGGGKFWQHARCASAHITFAAFGKPSGGGGTGVELHSTQRNVEMKWDGTLVVLKLAGLHYQTELIVMLWHQKWHTHRCSVRMPFGSSLLSFSPQYSRTFSRDREQHQQTGQMPPNHDHPASSEGFHCARAYSL